MTANELWNTLSGFGLNETVTIDATGLKIGPKGHVDVPVSPELHDIVVRAHWSDGLASDYLRAEL